ncbi:cytochrome P450 [Streptomyces canus]|uniref:cytochrome P450 n=1 Tax=Streptomyces canus TaxID=58343 RepID=UPI00224FD6AA|nr:cytochrome P450 [Streptomyces canus]MCX5252600.1 cytochrome P450 [Streptomyces canus]
MHTDSSARQDSVIDAVDRPVYDPFSWELHEDPYPVYAWMRENEPVYRNEERDFWALSRHEDVLSALRSPKLFSNRNGISLETELWGPEAYKTSFFLAMDPPEHGRLRTLVSSGFTARHVTGQEGRIRRMARDRLLPLLEQGEFDFASDYAAALPNDIVCDMVGIPAADWDLIRADTDMLNMRGDGEEDRPAGSVQAALRLASYFVAHVTELRRKPGHDLTSHLLDVRVKDRPLSDSEIVAFLFLLITAGNESTGKVIGNAWYHGWLHPDVKQAGLEHRPDDWTMETLRYDSASQMVARTVTEDTVLHDVLLPEGSRVAVLPASGNRDRRVFSDPDRFDLDRDTSQLISFGHGPHYCLGAALAKLEIKIALEEIGARISDYDIDMTYARRVHSPHQRGYAVLPTSVTLRDKPRDLPDVPAL